MTLSSSYSQHVMALLTQIETTQSPAIHAAAGVIYRALSNGGVLHVFSTGHSHMMVEEMFYRTGGLVPVNPIFDPNTMLHQGAMRSTQFERLSGYARVLLDAADPQPGEPILIISNSGINPVPVEMAELAQERNLPVLAITSVQLSSQLTSRAASRQRLMDIADQVIDNCICGGDAAVEVPSTGQCTGALSTLAGVYIVQRLVVEVVDCFDRDGIVPPIYCSANVPGGDERNKEWIARYKPRIRAL